MRFESWYCFSSTVYIQYTTAGWNPLVMYVAIALSARYRPTIREPMETALCKLVKWSDKCCLGIKQRQSSFTRKHRIPQINPPKLGSCSPLVVICGRKTDTSVLVECLSYVDLPNKMQMAAFVRLTRAMRKLLPRLWKPYYTSLNIYT